MDRSVTNSVWLAIVFGLVAILPSTGCLHQILATGIYIAQGGNLVDADCEALEGQRVVVFCRPPSSSEYSHAGASREIAKRVSAMLEMHVPGVDVVNPREVDNWLDENDSQDYEVLGQAVAADRVVRIELDHFDLFKGKTLYQGNADVTITVYDMQDKGRRIWDRRLGEVLFPANSGLPAQDKSVRQFQGEFVEILSGRIARHFYKHDPHVEFALDSKANQ